MSSSVQQPKIVAESVELAGNRFTCKFCKDGHKFFSDIAAENPNLRYQYHHEGTPEEMNIRQGIDYMPRVRYCKINEKGEKVECRIVDGFDKGDWRFLGSHLDLMARTPESDLDSPIEL